MATALDAMPVKELVADDMVRDDTHVCAIGAVAVARKLDVSDLDISEGEAVSRTFGMAPALAREIAYMNDEGGPSSGETTSARWTRMREWVRRNIIPTELPGEEPKR